MLYSGSFLPLTEVFLDFCFLGASYAAYDKIPRVQAISEGLGLTRHLKGSTLPSYSLKNDLVLIRVNKFFFERFRVSAWREDHHIWLTDKTATGYLYFNQFPFFARLGDISFHPFDESPFAPAALRDAKGILKIAYKRTYACLQFLAENGFFSFNEQLQVLFRDQIVGLQKFYLLIEIQSARDHFDFDAARRTINEFIKREEAICTEIKF